MAWVEDVSKRGQKHKHFYDASANKWKAEFTIHDRHFKDEFNQWQDVDETLEDDTGGFDKKCTKTRHIFRIASGGNRRWYPRRNVQTEYVDIIGLEYWSAGSWHNLNLPAAVWKSQGAEWDLAYLYASITNTWRSIKTDFIMKNASCPTGLRFQLALTGLTYNHATGELTSIADGLVWGYIQKPTAQDANGTNVPVTSLFDGTYIEWSVDTTGAIFPIAIDPTFTDGYGGDVQTYKDTFVQEDLPLRNYGLTTARAIQLSPGFDIKFLIEFDLSSISSSATCNSATLYIYQGYGGLSDVGDNTVSIYSIASGNDGWIEGTKTGTDAGAGEPCWNAKESDGAGGVTTAWAGSAGLETADTDYETPAIGTYTANRNDPNGTEYISVLSTSRVEDWFGGTNTNYGLLFHAFPSVGAAGGVCTSDHATTGWRPKLVVEYTENDLNVTVNPDVTWVPGVRIYTP